jgi:hypothetical protein
MATTDLSVSVKQVLGAAFVEVLTGSITDETIAAVANIRKEDVPPALVDAYHAIQGMSTHPIVRESASRNILGEFYAAAESAHKAHLG